MTEDMEQIFAQQLEQLDGFRTQFEPGERLTGRISAINRTTVFVDIKAKSEGLIDRQELEGDDGELTVQVGDEIECYFSHASQGETHLTMGIQSRDADDQALHDAYVAQIPVEGRIESERTGGFEVRVGDSRGFCPFSQISLYGSSGDSSQHVGQRYAFLITEYEDGNCVLSRRRLLERERAEHRGKLQETLAEGQIVSGVVSKLMDFGAFVDLGGVEGLIPMSELAWNRVESAEDVLSIGDKVQVYITSIDWPRDRFSLSLRKVQGDPWDTIADKFHETKCYPGRVTRLMPFGAFVELAPGIEGLIHISKLGAGKRLFHAREVLTENEELEVYIAQLDLERKRISLTLENPQQGRTMEVEGIELTIGQTYQGRVADLRQFGIFVQLSPSQTGLLHISKIPLKGSGNRMRQMWDAHPPDSEITVIVDAVHEGKISLSLPYSQKEDDEEYKEYLDSTESDDFGSLGSAFDGLTL